MSYDEAFEIIKAVVQKYSKVRENAVKEAGLSKIAAFHTIGEVLYRFERVLNYVAEIEKHEDLGGAGKICNSWYYLSNNSISSVSRLKPFLSITFEKSNNTITFSSKEIGVSLTPTQIKVLFRGKVFEIPLTLEGVGKNANLIKALSSKLMLFTDSLGTRIEQCAKLLYGIRL